jgi:secreted trypsin-like serine protease
MRALAWCALAARVAQSAGTVSVNIVGGQPVPAGSSDYLWAASLQDASGKHLCGGTLVAPGWVVTAAHCVFQQSVPAQVVLGAVMLGDSNAVRRSVQNVVVHEQYNPLTMRFDIALLRLSADVTSIAPLGLIEKSSQEACGRSAGVVGWGATHSYGGTVSQLRVGFVPVQTYATCTASGALSPKRVFNDVNICAGFTAGGVDSCLGDSGGPLFSLNPPRLIGVTSWGQGCGLPQKYGVYSRVSAVRSWVVSRIGGNVPGSRPPTFSRSPTPRPSSTARPTRRPTPFPTPFPTPSPTPASFGNDNCAGKTKRVCKTLGYCQWDSDSRTCVPYDPYTTTEYSDD